MISRKIVHRAVISALLAGSAVVPLAWASTDAPSMPVIQGITLNPTLTVTIPLNNALSAVQQDPGAATNVFLPDDTAAAVSAATASTSSSDSLIDTTMAASTTPTGEFATWISQANSINSTAQTGQEAFAQQIASTAPAILNGENAYIYQTNSDGGNGAPTKDNQYADYYVANNYTVFTPTGEFIGDLTYNNSTGNMYPFQVIGYPECGGDLLQFWFRYTSQQIDSGDGPSVLTSFNSASGQSAIDSFIVQTSPYEITSIDGSSLSSPYYMGSLFENPSSIYLSNGSSVDGFIATDNQGNKWFCAPNGPSWSTTCQGYANKESVNIVANPQYQEIPQS
jgi:hypothetical protein